MTLRQLCVSSMRPQIAATGTPAWTLHTVCEDIRHHFIGKIRTYTTQDKTFRPLDLQLGYCLLFCIFIPLAISPDIPRSQPGEKRYEYVVYRSSFSRWTRMLTYCIRNIQQFLYIDPILSSTFMLLMQLEIIHF